VVVLKADCSWDGRYDGGVGSAGASVDRATNQDPEVVSATATTTIASITQQDLDRNRSSFNEES
jgi:hypothetical protein